MNVIDVALVADVRLCACGCGRQTKKRGSKYVIGHWKRKHGFTAGGFDVGAAKVNERMARVYGVTREQYDAMVLAQGGRCAICRVDEPGKGSSGKTALWCIDHDHTTNAVRGLLCRHCNTAVGLFKDNPEVMERAAEYVRAGGVQ